MRFPFSYASSLFLAAGLFTGSLAQNLIPDGDFESGLGSWTVQVPDPSAATSLTSPGYTASYAFQVHFTAPATSPQLGVSARIIAPAITVSAGTTYQLTFATFFDNWNAGFVGVLVNDSVSVTGTTVDARDHSQLSCPDGQTGSRPRRGMMC